MATSVQNRDPGDEGREPVDEDQAVRDMRMRRLLDAGFEYEDAYLIAKRLDVDWRQAIHMFGQGCSSHMVTNILL